MEILNTVGLNSRSKLSFRLHLRIFYISFHFLTQLARYTSIVDQEILLKFSFDAKTSNYDLTTGLRPQIG